MIEIDDEDCGDDEIKYENYINDPNFIFYTIAAQRYGFKIDKNVPLEVGCRPCFTSDEKVYVKLSRTSSD